MPATRVASRNEPAASAKASGTSAAVTASASASRCGRCEMAAAAASCSSDLAGTTTAAQSSASVITIDHTAGSTWSSTLTTQGALVNNPRVAGGPTRMRGARHRVTADEALLQSGRGDLVEHRGLDAGDVGQRTVGGRFADVGEHARQRRHRHGQHDQRVACRRRGSASRRVRWWHRSRRSGRLAHPPPTGCSRRPRGRRRPPPA